MRNPDWAWFDRLGLWIVLVIALIMTPAYFYLSTDRFIRPVSLTYSEEDGRFTFTRYVWDFLAEEREMPDGTVVRGHPGRWWSTITLIDGEEFECNSGPLRGAFYQITPGNTVKYNMGAWAAKCLEAGPPFYVTMHRQVMLFGWIPLRPSLSHSGIEGIRDEPAVILVVPPEG